MRRAYLWFGAGLLLAAALPAVAQFYNWPVPQLLQGPVTVTGGNVIAPAYQSTVVQSTTTTPNIAFTSPQGVIGSFSSGNALWIGAPTSPSNTNFTIAATSPGAVYLNATGATGFFQFWINGANQFSLDSLGAFTVVNKCDTTASPSTGTTCNQAAGRVSLSSTNAAYTVTNSEVAATSIVNAVLQFTDATCTAIKSIVPGTGSFVINVNAACAANTNIAWHIVSK